MYVNAKMRSAETIPGMGGVKNDGVGEFSYDIL
jgi:hypothetical protein